MGKKVLVVDDVEQLRNLIAEHLNSDHQFTVSTAGSGNEALQLCREKQFDLMLTDVSMPGMTGIELIPHVRKLQPAIKVMLMSSDDFDAEDLKQINADAFIRKPFKTIYALGPALLALADELV